MEEKLINVTFLVVGAFLGVLFDSYIKRPKLAVAGASSGGGIGPGYVISSIRIMNKPGLLGIRLGNTVLFGKHLFNQIEKGITIERSTAKKCTAVIRDRDNHQEQIQLWWGLQDGTFAHEANIKSGEYIELMLLARLHEESEEFFIFEPNNTSSSMPKIPTYRFEAPKCLQVVVHHSYGRQKLHVDLDLSVNREGRLHYRYSNGGGTSF